MSQPRQPKGVPTGGQWQATTRPEGKVRLSQNVVVTDPAKTLERITERLHTTEATMARAATDTTLSARERTALVGVCAKRLRALRGAYTRAFRQLESST